MQCQSTSILMNTITSAMTVNLIDRITSLRVTENIMNTHASFIIYAGGLKASETKAEFERHLHRFRELIDNYIGGIQSEDHSQSWVICLKSWKHFWQVMARQKCIAGRPCDTVGLKDSLRDQQGWRETVRSNERIMMIIIKDIGQVVFVLSNSYKPIFQGSIHLGSSESSKDDIAECDNVGCKIIPTAENPFGRCPRCGQVFYCSRKCQKVDWTRHKDFCKRYMETLNLTPK